MRHDENGSDCSVRLTARAVAALNEICGSDAMVRLHAEPGGCNGNRFTLSLCDSVEDGMSVTVLGGVRLVVDPRVLARCVGLTIDYLETADGAGFLIRDPATSGRCGCAGHTGCACSAHASH